MTGLAVVVGVLLAATAFGWWHRRRDGRIRSVAPTPTAAAAATLVGLGLTPGAPTLLQFSSAVCAPCRATRRVLERVSATVDGVRLLEVEAEQQLAAARELGVWRTPTVLLVDGEGRVARRVSGVPDLGELVAAVRELTAGANR
ncbi:thioredoxin [Micromonospora radicis]|uniref:Thioredoxin n=1 Tax=Micromonospora radicis TaxID=1894971 RepID=A0A418MTT5_9ACTN|nr:thioredoxin [Micromonospora radicis]